MRRFAFGWLAEPKLSRLRDGQPTSALRAAARHPSPIRDSLNLPSRRLVDQNSASWNPLLRLFWRIDALRSVA